MTKFETGNATLDAYLNSEEHINARTEIADNRREVLIETIMKFVDERIDATKGTMDEDTHNRAKALIEAARDRSIAYIETADEYTVLGMSQTHPESILKKFWN